MILLALPCCAWNDSASGDPAGSEATATEARHAEAEVAPGASAPELPPATGPVAVDATGSDGTLWRGRVLVKDASGADVEPVDGRLSVTLARFEVGNPDGDPVPRSVEVLVTDGAWAFLAGPRERLLHVEDFRAVGAPVVPEEPRRWYGLGDTPIVWRARRARPHRVHVVSQSSGRELSDLTVALHGDWFQCDRRLSQIPDELVLLQRVESPIVFPPERGRTGWLSHRALLVSAPGYAWRWLSFDQSAGGAALLPKVR